MLDHTIKAWDIESGQCVHTLENVAVNVFTILLAYGEQHVLTAIHNQIFVFNMTTLFPDNDYTGCSGLMGKDGDL